MIDSIRNNSKGSHDDDDDNKNNDIKTTLGYVEEETECLSLVSLYLKEEVGVVYKS